MGFIAQLPDRDLSLIHFLYCGLIDALGHDGIDEDVAENVVARRLQAVARFRLLIEAARDCFQGEELDVDELVENLVEFRAVDFELFALLDQALHPGLQLHV